MCSWNAITPCIRHSTVFTAKDHAAQLCWSCETSCQLGRTMAISASCCTRLHPLVSTASVTSFSFASLPIFTTRRLFHGSHHICMNGNNLCDITLCIAPMRKHLGPIIFVIYINDLFSHIQQRVQ